MSPPRLKRRERTAIIKALQSGVVPGIGLQHLQVGRRAEIEAIVEDLDFIEEGGAAVRMIVGPFGSGKTFFLNLVRTIAHSKGHVVAHADVHTQRRLYSSQGQARSLYAALMNNLTTKASPQSGGLRGILERWVGDIHFAAQQEGAGQGEVEGRIYEELDALKEMVAGFDFASVIASYYRGFVDGDSELTEAALRWMRAEYTTKTEARHDLGVRTIIDDDSIYEHLKLMARFVGVAGYSGLVVSLDELGVLTQRISHPKSREGNFEVILQIVNDCLQGSAAGIGFLLGGVPEFVDDPRRGLNSYGALRTRLADNRFAAELDDYSGPVVRLDNLSPEDLFVLLSNIRSVFAGHSVEKYLITDEGIERFMQDCQKRIGAKYFKTPRDSVKDFVGLLSVLEQHPEKRWEELVGRDERETGGVDDSAGDDLETFQL